MKKKDATNMNWKGEIKPFANVDIDGKTVVVFREKYVRKHTASNVLNLFIENYPKLDKNDKEKNYDFLIIGKNNVTASYKKGAEGAPICWLKNVEIADSSIVIGNVKDDITLPDCKFISFEYKQNFYE